MGSWANLLKGIINKGHLVRELYFDRHLLQIR